MGDYKKTILLGAIAIKFDNNSCVFSSWYVSKIQYLIKRRRLYFSRPSHLNQLVQVTTDCNGELKDSFFKWKRLAQKVCTINN